MTMVRGSLEQCLYALGAQGVQLQPTEAAYWLVGAASRLTVASARSLLAHTGTLVLPAYVSMSTPHIANGVYGVGPDNQAWALFYVV